MLPPPLIALSLAGDPRAAPGGWPTAPTPRPIPTPALTPTTPLPPPPTPAPGPPV